VTGYASVLRNVQVVSLHMQLRQLVQISLLMQLSKQVQLSLQILNTYTIMITSMFLAELRANVCH